MEGIFIVIWFLSMFAGLAGFVIAIAALWRAMKAHESIAISLKEILVHMKYKQDEL